ncbi:hypothetical protein HYALB_00002477 [Hymenoscyphus albidus]|uniref:Mediator of RNA polymerase II transcription subunit 1 n=1 Tax=Hymenoscyphus albidus TaxID=595503 RepID=A0A9N9Q9U1_9HELO|nr:hypothetical protein HYALB_00002477 [Hymenoscyphus albidus]
MATPKHAAQVVATPPVSTPFSTAHLAFSPHGPRSVVPSPQQVKKSPANSNTVYGYPSGGGGHPTNSSFGGVGYDSPSAAMALGGVHGMGDLDAAIGGQGMGGLGGLGRAVGDDEKKRKLEEVVSILSSNKGRLSTTGIARLVQRAGLSTDWMDDDGLRVLICAGRGFGLDIAFRASTIHNVELTIPESPEIVSKHLPKAGKILMRNLKIGPGESSFTKELDRFAANLERLATLDKLSGHPGLKCHEALAGVYESLERLHLWEVKKIKEDQPEMGKRDLAYVERAAMCNRSGKPAMHVRDRIGLSLDYWQTKRLISSPTISREKEQTWSLLVECAPATSLSVFPPLRVSQDWISKKISKSATQVELFLLDATQGPLLDWQEPENVLFPTNDDPKGDTMEGIDQAPNQKVPEVIFVAKFDPPIIVPLQLAMQIHNATQAQFDVYQTTTFDELMFPSGAMDSMVNHNESRTIHSETTIPVFSRWGGSMNLQTEKSHRNTLLIDRIGYGRTLTELPFSHPKELVGILPSLRQYAFLSSLLKKTFGPEHKPKPDPEEAKPRGLRPSKNEEFTFFMSNAPPPTPVVDYLKLDVALQIDSDKIKLRIIFPFKKATADVTFLIKANAALEVVSETLLGKQKGEGKKLTRGDLARMLEVTEDLGAWVEFVRGRFA